MERLNSPSSPKAICLNVHVHNRDVYGNDLKTIKVGILLVLTILCVLSFKFFVVLNVLKYFIITLNSMAVHIKYGSSTLFLNSAHYAIFGHLQKPKLP